MRISYSALNTYKTCPLQFKYQVLDKIKTPKGVESIFGTLVHSSLKKMFEKTPLFPALDEVLDFFQNKWSEKTIENIPNDVSDVYLKEGLKLITNFYKKNPPWNFNIVELETRFEVSIEDTERDEIHTLAGIIDRVDKSPDPENGFYEIIDYKTSKRMPSQEILNKDLQLSIYNLGLLKKWPHLKPENIKLSLYFLKHNEKIETKRTIENLEYTKKEILKKINEIQDLIDKEKEFIATPSALCDWCGYKKMCPMWKHQYQTTNNESPITNDELKLIITEYIALKDQNSANNKQIKALQASISDFMNKNNIERVFGENRYITRILQERESFDTKKAKEILANLDKLDGLITKKQFPTFKVSKSKKT
ncbi:MAG: PD-(D/E)XK nuclease family protein [Candidatus Marinimicrobia bacterium]|nr:PD-(D/E)XK nuclease family protein [Candidatus Neomarinimicrobiota bacterium]